MGRTWKMQSLDIHCNFGNFVLDWKVTEVRGVGGTTGEDSWVGWACFSQLRVFELCLIKERDGGEGWSERLGPGFRRQVDLAAPHCSKIKAAQSGSLSSGGAASRAMH